MAERIRGIAGNGSLQGLAKDGIAGLIPGKVNPKVADDITINAKKGEYVIPQEVVAFLGKDKFDQLVLEVKKRLGLPAEIGPKRHDEPDSMGRMDKKGLRGIADVPGLAAGGGVLPDEPYETDFKKLGGGGNRGLAAPFRQMAGIAGNALAKHGFSAGLGTRTASAAIEPPPAVSPTPVTPQAVNVTTPAAPKQIAAATVSPEFKSMPSHGPGVQIKALSVTPTPSLAPTERPVGIAGDGSGFAEAGRKRINFRDIGTGRDPLTTRRDGIASAPDGQTILIGNPQGYRPSRHLDWSPDSANVNAMRGIAGLAPVQSNPANQESADQLALRDRFQETRRNTDAGRIQANNELISLHQQIANSPSMIGNQYNGAEQIAASRRSIADLDEQNKTLQVGINGDKALEAHRIAADASLAGHQIAGDATVRAAELGALGREAAARATHENDQAKSSAADRKDEEKRIFDLAKSWAKSATGMEHPDDVRTAHAYILGKSDFNKRFDAFMDGLKPQARQFWISGFKSRDPQVLAELAKRGIVDPAEPQFPSRQSALGGA